MAANQYSFIGDSQRAKMLLKYRADRDYTVIQRSDFVCKEGKGICKDFEKAATEKTRFECQGKSIETVADD